MLNLPKSAEPLRILALDPGTTCLGTAMIRWGVGERTFTVQHARTLQDRRLNNNHIRDLHGDKIARLDDIQTQLEEALAYFQPHVVISESPFMGRFAAAFAALTECLFMVRRTVMEYNPYIALELATPKQAKAAAGVDLSIPNDKGDVQRALMADPNIVWEIDPVTLDEHAMDSVAVSSYYIRNLA